MHKQHTQIQAFLHLKMHPSSRSRWVGHLRCTKSACIASLALCLVAPTISTAQTLIRCPDWKSYLEPQPALNKTVKRDFDKKLSAAPKPAQKPLDLMAAFRKAPKKTTPKPPTKTASLGASKTKRNVPKAVAIPIWKAGKGTYLIDAVRLWAKKAGYQTVIAHKGDWRFQINYAFEGSFKTNLKEVVKGFGTSGLAPKVTIYGNKVIRIGTR